VAVVIHISSTRPVVRCRRAASGHAGDRRGPIPQWCLASAQEAPPERLDPGKTRPRPHLAVAPRSAARPPMWEPAAGHRPVAVACSQPATRPSEARSGQAIASGAVSSCRQCRYIVARVVPRAVVRRKVPQAAWCTPRSSPSRRLPYLRIARLLIVVYLDHIIRSPIGVTPRREHHTRNSTIGGSLAEGFVFPGNESGNVDRGSLAVGTTSATACQLCRPFRTGSLDCLRLASTGRRTKVEGAWLCTC